MNLILNESARSLIRNEEIIKEGCENCQPVRRTLKCQKSRWFGNTMHACMHGAIDLRNF